MPSKYTTKLGDTWDRIAYKVYGDEMMMNKIIEANLEHKETYIFSAGVVLTLPEIEMEVSSSLPPWKQV